MNYPSDKSYYNLHDELSSKKDVKTFRATCLTDSSEVAIKIINLTTAMDQTPVYIPLPQILNHNTKFAVQEEDALYSYVVMPFIRDGSVAKDLTSIHGGLSEICVAIILKEVIKAVEILHTQGYHHGGIKPGNIFFDMDTTPYSVKLCSSFCRRIPCATEYWQAPETFLPSATINQKEDIWMLGITALEIVYGYPPVANCKDPSFKRVGDPKLLSYYLEQKQKLSAKCKNFIIRCLNDNPANRPTAEELLQDPFLQFEIENTTEFLGEVIYGKKLHSQIEEDKIKGWSLSERLLKFIPESACVEQGGSSNDNELDNFMVPVQNIQHSVQYVKSEIQFIKGLTVAERINRHLNNIEIAMSNIEDSAIQFHTLLKG